MTMLQNAPVMATIAPTPIRVQRALQSLGERITTARHARELTQADLARLADVGISTVASIEAGHPGVSMGNFVKVLRGLDVLEQVDNWLDPRQDQAVIDQGLQAIAQRSRRRE